MAYIRTRAIVLRCTDYSETSQVAAVCTPDLGQVHLLAKGSRRPRKDGRTPLDVLSHCDIVISQRRSGDLHLLTEWNVRESFVAIREHLCAFWEAFYALESAMVCTSESEDDGPVYGHLLAFLRRLDRERPERNRMPLLAFLMRLLQTVGTSPVTEACAQCGGAISGYTRFSPARGGALCGDCAMTDSSAFALSRGALAVMAQIACADAAKLNVRVTSAQADEIQRAFNEQIQYHLGRSLRTAKFLDYVHGK